MQSLIFDIKHFAVHDGPGLRTTIFFKGCPLRCWWCHNPESISQEPQHIEVVRRVGRNTFPEKQLIGQKLTSDEVIFEIEKDLLFFEESGGGVTFSGGEPLMHANYIEILASRCKEKNIHTALDTSGFVNQTKLQGILPFIDLFLYDIKFLDDNLHKRYTGVSNKSILDNFEFLIGEEKNIIIRYPLIPGINNSVCQLLELKDYLSGKVDELHFLPYHTIAQHKYNQVGLMNKMQGVESLSEEEINKVLDIFQESGFVIKIGG